MAIDVGEGLRGIQPPMGVRKIPPVEPSKLGYQRDSQFREDFQKQLDEHRAKGADVLHKVKYSYDKLYNEHGVQPNAVMITQDYLAAVIAECFGEYRAINMKPDQLLGMDVIPVIGKETVKVCIINKEE